MTAELERYNVGHVEVDEDTQIHLNTIEVDGVKHLEVRYYIVSTDHYGRGLVLPFSLARNLAREINAVLRS